MPFRLLESSPPIFSAPLPLRVERFHSFKTWMCVCCVVYPPPLSLPCCRIFLFRAPLWLTSVSLRGCVSAFYSFVAFLYFLIKHPACCILRIALVSFCLSCTGVSSRSFPEAPVLSQHGVSSLPHTSPFSDATLQNVSVALLLCYLSRPLHHHQYHPTPPLTLFLLPSSLVLSWLMVDGDLCLACAYGCGSAVSSTQAARSFFFFVLLSFLGAPCSHFSSVGLFGEYFVVGLQSSFHPRPRPLIHVHRECGEDHHQHERDS